MTGLDWILWAASIWSAWLLFILVDAPDLVARAAHHIADHRKGARR